MKTLNIPLEEFLRPFFDTGEKICLRIFDDRKSNTFKGMKIETTLANVNKVDKELHKHNKNNRGIYFVVNFGGHEDSDISRINAQFVECDDLTFDEQQSQIEAFPLEPSIIVKTQKSLHTYWLMKDADVSAFRRVQKRLAAKFGGDKSCVNESRVLRLPGFYHCKKEPVMVECVKFNPEIRYTQAELEAHLPEVANESVVAGETARKGSRKGLAMIESRCDFIKHCRANAASLTEHDWYSMITNLAVFEDGDKAIYTMSQKYPKYSAAETRDKISHFLKSGTKPITCKTIAEKGFVCPKLKVGGCGCKSPAALCYKALSVDELRAYLKDLTVSKSAVDNISVAQNFVRDCLYNVDSAVAATFIEYEIKSYFGFKAGDMKTLTAMQRELFKSYQSNKETKRETTGEELPEWYEPTGRGGLHFVSGLLADYMTKNVNAFYGAGSYFNYENGVYVEREDLWAMAKVRSFMIPRFAGMNAISDTVGQWRMLIRKPVREINCNPFIINLRNGLFNSLDDSFKPHTPDYFSTVQINATYDPSAECNRFQKYLVSMLEKEEAYLMQEILGYLLIPVNKAQKSFVFVGAANAGKSTLLSVVQDILIGSENVSNIAWQNLGDRFNKAELFGKLANIFADLPTKSIDDHSMFKALTGEDHITAERKNKDPFSFRPYARLLFSCNEIPKNYGDRSEGFYRRLIIIRFSKALPESKRDPNLIEKLAAERDGILMWSLIGLKRLVNNNYHFSETARTKAELHKYRVESNSVLSFIDEFCEVAEGKVVMRDELFTKYKEYCGNAGMKPVSQGTFNKDLESNHFSVSRGRDKVSRRHVWNGICYCEGGKDAD